MLLNLDSVFRTPGLRLPFAFALPASYDALPFASCPTVRGEVLNRSGVVFLRGTATCQLALVCDRCLADVRLDLAVPLEHTLVTELAHEDDADELVLVQSHAFAVDALVWEDLVLAQPRQVLCQPNCAGLCPHCGTNRNTAVCTCTAPQPSLLATPHTMDSF